MGSTELPIVAAKILCMTVLMFTAACGMKLDNKKSQSQGTAGDEHNELTLLSDGGYAVEVATGDIQCRRRVSGEIVELTYHQASGADAGLDFALTVGGKLASGDALTSDNADDDHYFAAQLTTPSGTAYHFVAPSDGKGEASGSLTILSASSFAQTGRLRLERLTPSWPTTTKDAPPISIKADYTCSSWE